MRVPRYPRYPQFRPPCDALGSRGSNMEEFKKELSKKRNIRVMTPNEIGDAMLKSLQYDKVTTKIKYYF